jgi:hypothetical protein
MTVFLKVKKINFYLIVLYEFKDIKNNLFTIRCAIKFDMNFVNSIFVY